MQVQGFFRPDATINVVHPFNELKGPDAYIAAVLDPLRSAFAHLTRADYIAFAGHYEGSDWVTSTGYYSGQFQAPWLGIQPTGTLAHLRFGEFHRMVDGACVESFIYFDIPELMIAANQWPITDSPGKHRGFTGYLPGPITQDGLQWGANDLARSASSLDMVTTMLRSLATEDEAWRPYWHDDMLWYGAAPSAALLGSKNSRASRCRSNKLSANGSADRLRGAKPGTSPVLLTAITSVLVVGHR